MPIKNDSGTIFSNSYLTSPVALAIDARRLDDGLIEGHAVLFDSAPAPGAAKIRAGAFRDSLAFHSAALTFPAMTWNHDPADLVGRWTSIREDGKGLRVTGKIAVNTARGEKLRDELQRGIDGLAVSYALKASSGGDVTAAHVFEVSLVKQSAIRSESAAPVFNSALDLERWLRGNGVSKNAAKKLAAGGWNALRAGSAEDDAANAERLSALLNSSIHEIAFRR